MEVSHSPLPQVKQETLLDFNSAISAILDGKKVTRKEWNDKRWYCLLKDDILSIHKAGESEDMIRPWTCNNGDLSGEDWVVL